jgi:hypothetical protein
LGFFRVSPHWGASLAHVSGLLLCGCTVVYSVHEQCLSNTLLFCTFL